MTFRAPPYSRTFYGITALMVVIIAVLVALGTFGIDTIAGVTAYERGEGLWSKAQKDAVLDLVRYEDTRDERVYQRFLEHLAVPRGDRRARLELEKPHHDLAAVREGFIAGGNDPADVPTLITLYERFARTPHLQRTIELWRAGDGEIGKLAAAGERLHAQISSGHFDEDQMLLVLADVDAINLRLTRLENAFSDTLGDLARWLQRTLVVAMLAAAGLLIVVGVGCCQMLLGSIRRGEQRRKKLEAQLLASDRMVSVGTLASGIAHEINNPLAYAMANVSYVGEQLAPEAARLPHGGELVNAIRDASHGLSRVRDIVRGLKTFARTDEDRRTQVDVRAVLDGSIDIAWNELRHRARVVREYADGLPSVFANEAQLGQVFLNLLVNAAQAIHVGDAGTNEIRVRASAQRNEVVVEVQDTGSGIAPAHRGQLFDPFFTTKPIGEGTGLGLFVCQNIVTALGGRITFESEPGKGTTFRVALPASSGAAAEPVPPVPLRGARHARVLVIDDEPQILTSVARSLPEDEVVGMTSATDALARLRGGDRFDAIVCDLMMPQVTGMELHAALARELPAQAARMIFVTGGAFTSAARAFLDTVKNPRIEKPFDVGALRTALDQVSAPAPLRAGVAR